MTKLQPGTPGPLTLNWPAGSLLPSRLNAGERNRKNFCGPVVVL